MKPTANIDQLYKKFLAGECLPEELHQLFHHFGTTDETELRGLIRKEFNAEENGDNRRHQFKLRALYGQIETRISETRSPKRLRLKWTLVAASLTALSVLSISYYLLKRSQPARLRTVYAANGSVLNFRLPDSSEVWLNAGSTLSYPESFKDGERAVSLRNGEAFFNVVRDPGKPFTVQTKETKVRVLGTSFEVNSFDQDKAARITVASGKVGVGLIKAGQKPVFLLAGERAVVDKSTGELKKTRVAAGDIAAWREQRLVFEDQPLPEVLRSLERRYKVQIQLQNGKLSDRKVTMRLNNQPLDDVLGAMGFSYHFTYQKINEQLVVVE